MIGIALFLTWAVPTGQIVGDQYLPLAPEEILGYQVYRRPIGGDILDLERVEFVDSPSYDDGTDGAGFCWRVQTVTVLYEHGPLTPEICETGCHM